MELYGYIASLLMGITLGLMGGGGSILTVPIMVYLFALAPIQASTYSLFIVGISALFGSFAYWRRKQIAFRAGLQFALPSILGVFVARSFIVPHLPEVILEYSFIRLSKDLLIMLAFSVLMIAASVCMIRGTVKQPLAAETSTSSSLVWAVFQGFLVGLTVGFVGAGGGFLIVPALIFLSKLSMRVAVGTSLLLIAIQSLVGFGVDLQEGLKPNWFLLFSVTAMAGLGIVVASFFSHRVSEAKLKKTFGWLVLLMGTSILSSQMVKMN